MTRMSPLHDIFYNAMVDACGFSKRHPAQFNFQLEASFLAAEIVYITWAQCVICLARAEIDFAVKTFVGCERCDIYS